MSSNHSLNDLFAIERETHLAALVEGCKSLKSEGYTDETLKKVFRAAHSLKGAARLVNLHLFEKQAHELEEIFKKLEQEKLLSPENISKIDQHLSQLGITATDNPSGSETFESSLLHITSGHISELMQLASELSVLTKRIDGEISLHLAPDSSLSEDGQHAASIASTLQRLTYRLRLTALHEITSGLPDMAQKLAHDLGKKLTLRIFNSNTLIDRDLLRKIEPCLIQLLRNSLDHGLEMPAQRTELGKSEKCQIVISAKQCGASVEIEFRDDGQGVSLEDIRAKVVSQGLHDHDVAARLNKEELLEFLFLPGFSTKGTVTTLSGRGFGLDIVKSTLQDLDGDVSIKTEAGFGTSFILRIPSRIASFRSLIFKCADNYVGVPLCFVNRVLGVGEAKIIEVCGNLNLSLSGYEIPLVDGAQFLELAQDSDSNTLRPILVLQVQEKRLAVLVDSLEEEREVVVHPLDRRYEKIDKVMGIAGSFANKIVTIVNPEYLLTSAMPGLRVGTIEAKATKQIHEIAKILVVDDSLTVRELERRLLIQEGFDCDIAIDSLDGLEKLTHNNYSLIITDIDMPRLNGFELIEQIRLQKGYETIPILVVSYKERSEDGDRALTLGANAYLSKGSFKDDSFVQTVKRLLLEYGNA